MCEGKTDVCEAFVTYKPLSTTIHDTVFASLVRSSHSISFTKTQSIPKYKIGLGRGKDGRDSSAHFCPAHRGVGGGGGEGVHFVSLCGDGDAACWLW